MDELEQQESRGIRKSFKYKLKPTPEQERALAFVVRRCRELYNAALEERKEAWEKCSVSITLGRPERSIARHQEGPLRILRHPLPGLAGRAHPLGSRLSGLLPPGQKQ